MSWPIAAAVVRVSPCPLLQHPKPMAPACLGAPNTHPRERTCFAHCQGSYCHPCGMVFNGQACAAHAYSWAGSSLVVDLLWGDLCKRGARQGDCKAPLGWCLALLAQSSPPAPAPVPMQWDTSPMPGAAAPEVTFPTARVGPGACHCGSKGRLMGGFYYSQFCRGILPLSIIAFPPVTRGEAQGKAVAGSVCSNASRCVFKAMVFGAKPFSALPVRWILHPFGGGRQCQCPNLQLSQKWGCFD